MPLWVELVEQLSKARLVPQRGDVTIADQPAVVSVKRTVTNQVDGEISFADQGGQFDRVVVDTAESCIRGFEGCGVVLLVRQDIDVTGQNHHRLFSYPTP